MHIRDNFGYIRQQLQTAKELSGQARQAFTSLDANGESAGPVLDTISESVYEAGQSGRPRQFVEAGKAATTSLETISAQSRQATADFASLQQADPAIARALKAARMSAESLAIPSTATWFLRNSIDSAQKEGGHSMRTTQEIGQQLNGLDWQIADAAKEASNLSKPRSNDYGGLGGGRRPRSSFEPSYGERHSQSESGYGSRYGSGYGHSHGHRPHGRQHSGEFSARRKAFREAFDERRSELYKTGMQLDDHLAKIDDVFGELDWSAGHGVQHQSEVAFNVDAALGHLDRLEKEFSAPAPVAPRPKPRPTPPASKPIEPPSSPQSPSSPPQTEPEGFFKKPWQPGGRKT